MSAIRQDAPTSDVWVRFNRLEIFIMLLHFDLAATEVAWIYESLKEEISHDC